MHKVYVVIFACSVSQSIQTNKGIQNAIFEIINHLNIIFIIKSITIA